MEKYDWESNLKMNILVMRIMGLWPEGDETYKVGFYLVYSCLMVILFVLGFVLTQVIKIYFVRDNLQAVVGIIYIILIEFMASFKVYYVIKKMKFLKGSITSLKSDWFQPRNSDQKLLIEPGIKFWKSVYRILLVLCFACNAFLMLYPLLDASEERRLPFLAWYPFDSKVSPFYEISYVHQVIGSMYLTSVHLNVDTLISGFNVYTGCQFDMLSDNLRNFATIRGIKIGDNLIKCVLHHKKILSFVEGCNHFFNWIIFWHLIISGVSIGITMFQLTLVVPLSNEFYSLLSYGSSIVIQIFMYCWFGNEVQVKSNLVSYAVFESDWIDLPPTVKKNILFFTTNLLEPIKISAFNVFHLSLDTFVKILKTAWSYFALLYQLGARD